MRRRAQRRRAKHGAYFVVPDELAAWEAGVTTDPALPAEAHAVMARLAHLLRRAVIVDGARPGDEVWIDYADLGRVA